MIPSIVEGIGSGAFARRTKIAPVLRWTSYIRPVGVATSVRCCLPAHKSNLCWYGIPAAGIPADSSCVGPMVEGYAWATDSVGLQVLLKNGKVFQQHPNKVSAIIFGEETMSRAIFKAGYSIDSLLLAYEGVDWTNQKNWGCNKHAFPSRPRSYFGITEHPLETVFVKTSWETFDGQIVKILPEYLKKYTKFKTHDIDI